MPRPCPAGYGAALTQALLEPAVGERLVVEGRDLHVARAQVERDRLGQVVARLDPSEARTSFERPRLELREQPPSQAETPRRRVHPHPLDLARLARVQLDGAAADGLAAQIRDEH